MTTDPAARLTGEQLASLLHSLGHADSVELKLTVPESSQRSTLTALEVDPLDAQIRQVFFLDTPGLDADRAGVVVRARRVQRRRWEDVKPASARRRIAPGAETGRSASGVLAWVSAGRTSDF